jgi:hypothetical protein
MIGSDNIIVPMSSICDKSYKTGKRRRKDSIVYANFIYLASEL